jgi:hypothetical protein
MENTHGILLLRVNHECVESFILRLITMSLSYQLKVMFLINFDTETQFELMFWQKELNNGRT